VGHSTESVLKDIVKTYITASAQRKEKNTHHSFKRLGLFFIKVRAQLRSTVKGFKL
jgi:hypothetical protein